MPIDKETFQAYMQNPAEHFESPLTLALNSELSPEQKKEILQSWKLDEKELQVAADENMTAEQADRLAQVESVISQMFSDKGDT